MHRNNYSWIRLLLVSLAVMALPSSHVYAETVIPTPGDEAEPPPSNGGSGNFAYNWSSVVGDNTMPDHEDDDRDYSGANSMASYSLDKQENVVGGFNLGQTHDDDEIAPVALYQTDVSVDETPLEVGASGVGTPTESTLNEATVDPAAGQVIARGVSTVDGIK